MTAEINLQPDLAVRNEVKYTLNAFSINKRIDITYSSSGIIISDANDASIRLSKNFITNFTQKKFGFANNLNPSGFVETEAGQTDYISTAFYYLACLQEYDPEATHDNLDRFKFTSSGQWFFKTAEQNIVQYCFDKLAETLRVSSTHTPSRFFLSHDIDSVYGSLLQDGFYALKRGRIDIILKLLFNTAISRPDWLNIDQIMKLESEYDCRSAFFWIVNKGKSEGIENADYTFRSAKIQSLAKNVELSGFDNGLHKSVSTDSFEKELDRFTERPSGNRYHYLKFNLPEGFDAIEQAGLKLDASLGFAETMGFRNGYGQPYNPYHLNDRRPYNFLEVPLNVMDRTFFQYNRISPAEAQKKIMVFFEQHRKNCVLSVLWHNNFFTNYKFKGYLDLYKSILAYIRDNNFSTINQEELIKNYSIKAHGH